MKHLLSTSLTAFVLFTGSPAAMAAPDYGNMKTEELAALRGKLQNEPSETREAFQKEWQKRVESMSPEEKKKYANPSKPAGGTNDAECQ
ncbi:MAG: hypothetical protein HGB29_06570 [Chlorobiaceae bacterium]|nr:hypothetical protein [Chlorobiaceae bacterium]NTW74510.1 hypothetical protein [Chlorobiaceae bacterium]